MFIKNKPITRIASLFLILAVLFTSINLTPLITHAADGVNGELAVTNKQNISGSGGWADIRQGYRFYIIDRSCTRQSDIYDFYYEVPAEVGVYYINTRWEPATVYDGTQKQFYLVALLMAMMILMVGCCIKHEWQSATCTVPKTCSKCQEVEGEALEHSWYAANCMRPRTCSGCGITDGEKDNNYHSLDSSVKCNYCYQQVGKALTMDNFEDYSNVSLNGTEIKVSPLVDGKYGQVELQYKVKFYAAKTRKNYSPTVSVMTNSNGSGKAYWAQISENTADVMGTLNAKLNSMEIISVKGYVTDENITSVKMYDGYLLP